MQHGPTTKWKKDKSESFKTRTGLIMFAIYITLYMVFVILCVFNPKLMTANVGGLNLAVAYGFTLIAFAIVQALIYNYIIGKREKSDEDSEDEESAN